jgi:hypothetical protein
LLILITIHYCWINITTVDQPPKMSLTVTRLYKDATSGDAAIHKF